MANEDVYSDLYQTAAGDIYSDLYGVPSSLVTMTGTVIATSPAPTPGAGAVTMTGTVIAESPTSGETVIMTGTVTALAGEDGDDVVVYRFRDGQWRPGSLYVRVLGNWVNDQTGTVVGGGTPTARGYGQGLYGETPYGG